ncbi:CWC15 [Candida margitis]|uniref:CWC15 n=1 Tax=Candida margitis TaxID=1775924 RepID=UPI0022261E41|nr:CWC15 [Candida margitis]KAI5969633.1 CWC15 [Candida margitis]
MTTNHRPTLESKKGKNITIRDSIVHARSLPQSQNLKLRSDIPAHTFDSAVTELKNGNRRSDSSGQDHNIAASLQANNAQDDATEGESSEDDDNDEATPSLKTSANKDPHNKRTNQTIKRIREGNGEQIEHCKLIDKEDTEVKTSVELLEEGSDAEPKLKKSRVKVEAAIGGKLNNKSSSGDEEDDEDEDEDEGETAALIAEINRIKQDKTNTPSIDSPFTSQLPNSNQMHNQDLPPKKRGWRKSAKRFNDTKEDQHANFTTDSLNSQFHNDFLSKYIK